MRIRPRIIQHIFMHEIRETFRDRLATFLVLGGPFFLWPGMVLVAMFAFSGQVNRQIALKDGAPPTETFDRYQIALIGDAVPGLIQNLEESKRFEIQPSPNIDLVEVDSLLDRQSFSYSSERLKKVPEFHKQIDELLRSEDIDLVVATWKDSSVSDAYPYYWMLAFYRWTDLRSRDANDWFTKNRDSLKEHLRASQTSKAGLDPQLRLQPLRATSTSVETATQFANYFAGLALPAIFTMAACLSLMHVTTDTIVGEKERGTICTLLCTPVEPLEWVLGKYCNITLFGILGALSNVASFFFMGLVLVLYVEEEWNFLPVFMGFIGALPLTALCSAIFVAFLMFASTQKQAGYAASPILLVLGSMSYITFQPDIELDYTLSLVPLVGINLLMKALVQGTATIDLTILTILSTLGYTFAVLLFAARVFASESTRFGLGQGFAEIFTLRRNALPQLNASISVFLFLVTWILAFYIQLLMGAWSTEMAVAFSMIGIFALLPLLFLSYFRLSLRENLFLELPHPKSLLGLPLCLAGMLILAAWSVTIFPPPPEMLEMMKQFIGVADTPLWLMLILFAVLPGICEEISFRGVILRGFLRNLKPWQAILLTSLLFGLAHYSIYRFLPTALAGLVLGIALWRSRSLFVPMILHILYNATSLTIVSIGISEGTLPTVTIWHALIGIAFCAAGLTLIAPKPQSQP